MSTQNNLMDGVRGLLPLEQFPWDGYAAEMADADVLLGRGEKIAAKSFYVRTPPFGGSVTYLFGVIAFLRTVSEIRFNTKEFENGMRLRHRSEEFIAYMRKHNKLKVRIYAPKEGTIFGPNEPIVTAVGYLPHIRLVEGMMNILNPASLLFTKWRRCVLAAGGQSISAFDRRRAQYAQLSGLASLASGVFGSSNEDLLRYFRFNLVATMGHEWVMGFPTIEDAFDSWLRVKPHKAVGLVDTHKVLEHDFPAWLDAVWNHREEIKTANPNVWGWRNDSGDLAYLPLRQWQMFLAHPLSHDPWFVEHARIFQTNDLDEWLIEEIKAEIASRDEFGFPPMDVINRLAWACGTKPGTAADQPSLGGVAKLMQVDSVAKIKLAFDAHGNPGVKTSIPGFNQSAKILDAQGKLVCIYVFPADAYEIHSDGFLYRTGSDEKIETIIARHPTNPGAHMEINGYHAVAQQTMVYDSLRGQGFTQSWPETMSITDIPGYVHSEEAYIDRSYLRLRNPHVIKVSVSTELYELRREMIERGQLSADAISQLEF